MEDSYQWVKNILFADERIQWRGKPEKLRLLESRDAYLIPFSLLCRTVKIQTERGGSQQPRDQRAKQGLNDQECFFACQASHLHIGFPC